MVTDEQRREEELERRRTRRSRNQRGYATGYRTDSERHRQARMKVPKRRRVHIARLGASARWEKHEHSTGG